MEKTTIRDAIDNFMFFLGDKTGRPSSSVFIPRKVIYNILRIQRNKVVREKIIDRLSISDKINIQYYFSCARLIPVDMVESPFPPRSGMTWMMTQEEVPRFIDEKPLSVMTVDGLISFNYVAWNHFKDKINSRLPQVSKANYYTLRSGSKGFRIYIYANSDLTEEKMLQGISFAGIPEDPAAAQFFPLCGNENKAVCNILDQEFYMPKDYEDRIYDLTMLKLSEYMRSQFGIDILNNEKDDRFTREDRPEL